ncbi:MAG TPA: ABC transporter substrate-binding protein [Acetobacteraceae bacterium]|nr:ABC transporter substrate-binding protein [Acetobacteraceae bacterium]
MRRRAMLTGSSAALLTKTAIGQDRRANTLRFVPLANLSVLDPNWSSDAGAGLHGDYVFDTLYAVDGSLTSRPQMASGHEVSDDGRTWRIRLRDGLTFHDATPVRAIDCIASLQRWCACTPFGQLLSQAVDTWAARDDRTIEIRLTRPFPLLLDAIALPDNAAWIMPEHLAHTDPNTAVKEMVGSGPYRFIADEYNSGSRVVYEKFDAYVPRKEPPDWASGGKIVHFGRVEWHVIPDSATAAAALMTGEVDWLEAPQVDLMPMLIANSDIGTKIANPYGKLGFIRFNCLQPPFDDVRLRRAVMRGVVQEDYMRAAFGDDTSTWTQCKSLWPRKTPYYSDDDASLVPGSLDAGRTALKDAGYAGQKVVILNPADRPDYSALAQVSADSLHRMGMNVDLQQTDYGSLLKRRASQESVERGGWSMFLGHLPATVCANPGSSFLVRGQGAAGWFGWWANAQAEELANAWAYAPDQASQQRFAKELGHLAMMEAPTIPLGQPYERTAFRKSITGILPGARPYPWNVRPA